MFLIIGCGYVGGRLADLLHAAGHEVVGVTHSTDSASRLATAKPYAVHACDVSDERSVSELASRLPMPPAVIIHCASSNRGGAEMYRKVYVDGCRNLLRSFPDAHLVFTSSSSVYSQTDGSWVSEESDAAPDRETSQLLREAEELVLAHHGCVGRLAGIYGPARSFVLKNFLEGSATIEGNDGAGRYLNQIHREDAASALMHFSVLKLRGIYNIVDDQPMTQRECFIHLAAKFDKPVPSVSPPKTDRKRAWTHKRISNAKLRSSGWKPRYESYFTALERDSALVPSIMDQVKAPEPATERGLNIVLVGLMGCGKTSVGRLSAQMLGFDFVDTDHLITEAAGKSIPDIFAKEGEGGFRKREREALRTLGGRRGLVIATGGGIVTQPENLPLLKEMGFVVWLSADPSTLHRRTVHNHDRPLLRNGDPEGTLRNLYEARKGLYESVADMKITTDDLPLEDVAYGLTESAKLHFRHHV